MLLVMLTCTTRGRSLGFPRSNIQCLPSQNPTLAATPLKDSSSWLPLHALLFMYQGSPFVPEEEKKKTSSPSKPSKGPKGKDADGKAVKAAIVWPPMETSKHLLFALLKAYPEGASVRCLGGPQYSYKASGGLLPLSIALRRNWDADAIEAVISAYPAAIETLDPKTDKEATREGTPNLKARNWARKLATDSRCPPEVIDFLPKPAKGKDGKIKWTYTNDKFSSIAQAASTVKSPDVKVTSSIEVKEYKVEEAGGKLAEIQTPEKVAADENAGKQRPVDDKENAGVGVVN